MPTTRARSRAAPCRLLELPDELLVYIGEYTYSDLPAALRLVQTCKRWRQILAPVQQKAVARRLRWNDAVGLHIRGAPYTYERYFAGDLLPQTGVSEFCLRITSASDRVGYHRVGICVGDETFSWGFNPCTGSLLRERRSGVFDTSAFPGHHGEHIWFGSNGERLQASRHTADGHTADVEPVDPTGVEVHIKYRPEAGLVTFRVGDGTPVTLSGFGAPLRLRPFALLMYETDGVAFAQPYIEYSNE